ncbi:MAG: hypothetical protein JAY66_25830 [Candidatus Thiodiazotropha taylori]|nr:hypothetical protein [Candidatus Thiodiazotropha taylori]
MAGATGSGKTTLLFEILRHGTQMFSAEPKRVIYCYGVYQKLYDEMKLHLPHIWFYEGLPSKDDLEAWSAEQPGMKVLVLDDLLQKAAKNPEIVDLFCQYSHHLNFSTFFLVQNLFADGIRCVSLNTHYFILLKNTRDQLQVQTLGRQVLPGQVTYFMDAFRKATEPKYGYLLIDLSPHSDPKYKLRTRILPGQLTIVYLPEKNTMKTS